MCAIGKDLKRAWPLNKKKKPTQGGICVGSRKSGGLGDGGTPAGPNLNSNQSMALA